MVRRHHVREHGRRTTPGHSTRVREHVRGDADPRTVHAMRLAPEVERELIVGARDEAAREAILDGKTDAEALAAAEAWLIANYVEPAARERIMSQVREYLNRKPSRSEIKAMQDATEEQFYQIMDQGRPHERGIEYASEVPYEIMDNLDIPPRAAYYDAAFKNVPDEETYHAQHTAVDVFTTLESNTLPNAIEAGVTYRPSRRQLQKAARHLAMQEAGEHGQKRVIRELKKRPDYNDLIDTAPLKDDARFEEDFYREGP